MVNRRKFSSAFIEHADRNQYLHWYWKKNDGNIRLTNILSVFKHRLILLTSIGIFFILFVSLTGKLSRRPMRAWFSDGAYDDCIVKTECRTFHWSLEMIPDRVELDIRNEVRQPRDKDFVFSFLSSTGKYYDISSDHSIRASSAVQGVRYELSDALMVNRKLLNNNLFVADSPGHKTLQLYTSSNVMYGKTSVVHVREQNTSSSNTSTVRTFSIHRSFSGKCEICMLKVEQNLRLVLIIPFSERYTTLERMLEHLRKNRKKLSNIWIMISVLQSEAEIVETIVKKVTASLPSLITVVSNYGKSNKFARIQAIETAASLARMDDILLIADVDLLIEPDAFENCRSNTKLGSQVYFPVMFSLFPGRNGITDRSGFWRYSSYGMVCVFREDFDNIGKFAGGNFDGWGGEDVHLYNKFRDNPQYAVFRALEPGLSHPWHEKPCDANEHFWDCQRTNLKTLGRVEDMAKVLISLNFSLQKVGKMIEEGNQ